MKNKLFKRLFSVILALAIVAGIIPVTVTAVPSFSAGGTAGESAENPILIDSMDQLIAEMEKNVTSPTYYKLTEDVSHETSIEYFDGREYHTGDDGYTTVRKPEMAQCVVGTGKKFLELDGYDIHYKNNVNFNLGDDNSMFWGSGPKYDSLTFFYLGEGCDLTVSNTTGDDAEVWYDGWMHNRTNFFGGPNYIYTAVRDVFRVESGAELTVNNTDIKAGRNRKIWMVHSYYTDKEGETNLLASITYNGFAYEQIYGSAIVANGGKVTINGGYIEGRGGYRGSFNVSGVPDWNKDSIADMVWGGDFTTDDMIENCLSNVGTKAAVQIAGEGSTVIINDGEFWGCGGADVIGITGLNGGSVNEYTLRINAGTFDTSKTDKERLPDRCAGVVNSGPWPWSHSNWMLWANCRCIRDTLRGDIGIPAVDGYGNNVFNTKMVHVYIDDEEPEDECIDNADLDFRRKSDHDTIIVKPREGKAYSFTDTHTWYNYNDRAHYKIYAYSGGKLVAGTVSGGGTLYNGPESDQTLFFSAESHFDMTDADNPYFDRAHIVNCKWVLYEEDENGNLINSYQRVTSPFKTEHKIDEEHGDGHTVYNFKISMSSFTGFSDVTMDENHTYYMVANMEEFFYGKLGSDYYRPLSYMENVFQDWTDGVYDGDGVLDFYYNMGLEIVYGQSLATCGAEVVYSNAVYGGDPELTFNDAFNEMASKTSGNYPIGTLTYQWQYLDGDTWKDTAYSTKTAASAISALNKHEGLTGKQVRLKITPDFYDKVPIYSNVCTVQKDQNTREPNTGIHSWREDPNHPGKYILESIYYTDMQEYLIQPHVSNTWDPSTLDWSNAKDDPVFDNLDMGYYDVFTRFKATDDCEAGTLVNRSKVAVGPYTLTQGFEIRYDGKPVDEVIVEVGKEFKLYAVANPEDATDKSIINRISWSPESDKTQMISARWLATYHKFENNYTGSSIWLRGDEVGVVTVQALTTLENGTNVLHKVTIRIVPEGYVPYTVSVVNRGTKVPEGGSFTPLIALHARNESKLDAELLPDREIKAQLQSQMLKQQLRDRLTWGLVDGRITQVNRVTVTNGKANININSGKITLNDTAKPGDVIRFIGVLNDPYLGSITFQGYITVVAAPAVEVHTHNYESFDAYDNTDFHYRVCECGEKISENHSFTEYTVEEATETSNKVCGYVCPCGYSYTETVDGTIKTHIHTLEYVYDNHDHWQICTDEDCPDEYSTEHQGHSFELQADDEGNEGYVCRVCKYCATEPLATLSGTVVSFGKATDNVTLQLIAEGYPEADYEVVVKGNSATYSIEGIAAGTYTLRVMKANHVTREYTVVVSSTSVVQDVKIHLLGDVTGDGRVRSNDLSVVYDHVSGEALIEDDYIFACADIDGNGRLRSNDVTKMYDHTTGDKPLW